MTDDWSLNNFDKGNPMDIYTVGEMNEILETLRQKLIEDIHNILAKDYHPYKPIKLKDLENIINKRFGVKE